MSNSPSTWSFILHSDIIVKSVLLILLAASIISWRIIFHKWQQLRLATQHVRQFTDHFWSGLDCQQYYRQLTEQNRHPRGLEVVFIAAFQALLAGKEQLQPRPLQQTDIESIERAIHVAASREIATLTQETGWLATIGSVSPYVGLLGTVMGHYVIVSIFR